MNVISRLLKLEQRLNKNDSIAIIVKSGDHYKISGYKVAEKEYPVSEYSLEKLRAELNVSHSIFIYSED